MNEKNDKVKQYYSAFAEDYDKMYETIQLQKYSQIITSPQNRSGWIADIGGGTALLSEYLKFPLLTIDLSFDMLTYALKQNRNFFPIAGDMQNLPFREKSIKKIYSISAIHNSSTPKQTISEFYRCLQNTMSALITYLKKSELVPEIHNAVSSSPFGCKNIQIGGEDKVMLLLK